MTKKQQPWSVLRGRFSEPDVENPLLEWAMPFADDDDAGLAAWAAYAQLVGARLGFGTAPEDKDEVCVCWDFPVVRRMQKAVIKAEKIQKQAKRAGEKRRIARVLRDLRSYRDTGYSSTSAAKPA